MSSRSTYRYEVADELKNVDPVVIAVHQYSRTKSGFIVVIYDFDASKDITVREFRNHYFYYFERTEIQEMLNTMIHDLPEYEQNKWTYKAYKFTSDLDSMYLNSVDHNQCMSMQLYDFTKELTDMIESAKSIKALL